MPKRRLPSIAVVIATRDRAAFLRWALASVERQSEAPDEVVVVDDGSVEPVPAPRLTTCPVRLLRTQGKGEAHARNAGNAAASADFVCVLDDDDAMLPNRIADHRAALARDPALDLSYGGWINIDDATGETKCVPGARLLNLRSLAERGACLAHGASAYRRALVTASRYDEAISAGVDVDLHFRLLAAGAKAAHTGSYVLLRRLHGASITTLRRARQQEMKRDLIARYRGDIGINGDAVAENAVLDAPLAAEFLPLLFGDGLDWRAALAVGRTLDEFDEAATIAGRVGGDWTVCPRGRGVRARALVLSAATFPADRMRALEGEWRRLAWFKSPPEPDPEGPEETGAQAFALAPGAFRLALPVTGGLPSLTRLSALLQPGALKWYLAAPRRSLDGSAESEGTILLVSNLLRPRPGETIESAAAKRAASLPAGLGCRREALLCTDRDDLAHLRLE